MAVICEQVYKELSISGNGKSPDNIDQTYLVIGEPDEMKARLLVMEKAPATLEGCPRTNVELDQHEGAALYFRVTYAVDQGGSWSGDTDDTSLSFDHNTSMVKRIIPIRQRDLEGDLYMCPINNGAGIETPIPSIKKSISSTMNLSELTVAWEKRVTNLFGKVNSKAWKGYQPGEVLFLGCSYSGVKSTSSRFNVTFNFAISFNETKVFVGKKLNGTNVYISKLGWEYFWGEYRRYQLFNQYIRNGYIATIYQYADLNQLGV